MNKLRRRFIAFNMIVISAITAFIAVLIYFGSPSQIPITRLLGIIIITLALVWMGSFLLSKIAMKPIQISWQRQLDFTADASHELRTPLAVIQTNLELVMGNPDETVGSQLKWLDNIHIETVRMAKLVDDLLTLSRGDADAKTLEYSNFSLNAIAKETVALFETAADQKEVAIQILAEHEILYWGDCSRIKQLFGILVDNAVKYMDRPGSVQIVLSGTEKAVQIMVSDTGKGIVHDDLTKIFNRFYRAGNEKQSVDGFGLGLSIAEWIVREHGGHIHVKSIIDEGTQFIANLPLRNENRIA